MKYRYGIAALTVAAAAWYAWQTSAGQQEAASASASAAPLAAPARQQIEQGGPSRFDALAESAPVGEGDVKRVALPPVDTSTPAWLALAQSREQGDPRTPPVQHDDPAQQQQATPEQLADPKAYHEFERGQHQRLVANFSQAVETEVPRLRADIDRARAAGIPDEELAKMEEKIHRLQNLTLGSGLHN